MELQNALTFATPKGLSLEDMSKVQNQLIGEFDWLAPRDLTVQNIIQSEKDGTITFLYGDEPYEQIVCITFDKNGENLFVHSNDADVAIDIYKSLCELEWGWVEI